MNIAPLLGMALLVVLALLAGWWLGSRATRTVAAPLEDALRENKKEFERLRQERDSLLANRAGFETQAKEFKRQCDDQAVELENLRRQYRDLTTEAARVQEQLKAGQAALASERELLTTIGKQLKDDFKLTANAVLTESNNQFLGLAKHEFNTRQQAIDTLLEPVKKTLDKLNDQTQQLESKREGAYEKLGQQLLQLDNDQKSLKDAATALSSALRNTRTTGKWGEIVLHRVVELAGMTEHCDFTQQHTQDDSRPDLIVHLPNGRTIIVDAKTTMGHFHDAADILDENLKQQKLKDHAKNIRTQAMKLASRRYERAFEDAVDMTICFIPGDVYYYAALQTDPGLFEAAANEKIIFATPTTLIALLKAAAFGWQQDSSRREAKEILTQAQKVYDCLTTASGHFKNLRASLNSSVENYDKLIGSLEGRVFPAARRMKELGIAGDTLPSIEPIDRTTRQLQAQDWQSSGPGNGIALAADAEETTEQ